MSDKLCRCGRVKNSGVGKQKDKKAIKGNLFVPKVLTNGSKPFIDSSFSESVLDGHLTNAEPKDRWHLIKFDEVTPTDQTQQTQTLPSGQNLTTGKTPRSFELNKYGVNPRYTAVLEQFECGNYDVYHIDDCGEIWGIWDMSERKLFPYIVPKKSIFTTDISAIEGSSVGGVKIIYQTSNLSTSSSNGVASDFDFNILLKEGLHDVFVNYTNAPAIGGVQVDFDLFLEYEDSLNPNPYEGLALADFGTTAFFTGDVVGAVTPTGLTKTEGSYSITVPALVADTYRLTLLKTVGLVEISDEGDMNAIVVA